MNLTFATQQEAQAKADAIHAALTITNSLYAESVALYISSGGKAGTARWAIPYQDLDQNGVPIDSLWHVTVDDRPRHVIPAEASQIPEWSDNMSFIRVVRKIPTGVSDVAIQSKAWGGYVDWVQAGSVDDIPSDAIYAAIKDDAGVYREVVLPPASLVFQHHPQGWNPASFPYPS